MINAESTQGPDLWDGPVRDETVSYPIIDSTCRFEGNVWEVRTDTVTIPTTAEATETVTRDVVVHTGAVGVIALNSRQEVYLLRQYRHPVSMALFEPPAGLLDHTGESALATAQRELAEEAGLEADTWNVLVDFFTSPGGTSEALRIFLARDVRARPGGRIATGEAEEVSMPGAWVPLDEAVSRVMGGNLGNPTAVVGILATAHAARTGFHDLRGAEVPWPAREHLVRQGRVFDLSHQA